MWRATHSIRVCKQPSFKRSIQLFDGALITGGQSKLCTCQGCCLYSLTLYCPNPTVRMRLLLREYNFCYRRHALPRFALQAAWMDYLTRNGAFGELRLMKH